MKYADISKEVVSHLYKCYESLKQSPIDPIIRVLVELRVSQVNGCEYCCKLHTAEAEKMDISHYKIDQLADWRSSNLFSSAEKAALEWCEEVTKLNKKHYYPSKLKLEDYFSEREIVDITLCASIVNSLNRLAITLTEERA